jgi:hypothetical protein
VRIAIIFDGAICSAQMHGVPATSRIVVKDLDGVDASGKLVCQLLPEHHLCIDNALLRTDSIDERRLRNISAFS